MRKRIFVSTLITIFVLFIFVCFTAACASNKAVSAEEYFSLGMAFFELGQAASDANTRTKHFLEAEKTDILRIYSYNSFARGIGPIVIAEFEKKYGVTVELIGISGGASLLNRLILERANPQVDLAIGILNTQLNRALAANVFQAYEPENLRNIKDQSLIIDPRFRLIPFDYSYYAFVYDTRYIQNPPQSFGAMQDSEWRDKIILINPRTSSTGYGLLIWTLAAFTDRGFDALWTNLRANVLTIPGSWSQAYQAFQIGEAPIVLSYVTSPAFHIHTEGTHRYQSFIPEEGGFREIEFAGILQGAENLHLARRFIEFMLSYEFQRHIPTTQWMFPVIEGVTLPESFSYIETPEIDLSPRAHEPRNRNYFDEAWIDRWLNIMTRN